MTKDLILNKKIDLEVLEGIVYEEDDISKDSRFVMTSNGVQEEDTYSCTSVLRVKQECLKDIFGDSFVCDSNDVASIYYKDLPELKDEVMQIIINKEINND